MGLTGALRRVGIDVVPGGIQIVGSLTADNVAGNQGKNIYVDPTSGSDSYTGRTPGTAVLTIAAGYAKLTAGQNDTLVYLSGTSSASIVDQLIWAKSYTHFKGIGAPTHMAQRSRIFNSGNSTDEYALLKVTGSGCIFTNFYLFQGSNASAEATRAMEITGGRNYFGNVHIAGMGAANGAGDTDSASLFLNGAEENLLERCTIGVDTIKRTADNAQLLVDGGCKRNHFLNCRFVNWSETAAHVIIRYVDDSAADRFCEYESCRFSNFWTNHVNTLTELMDARVGATHDDIFTGLTALIGIKEIDAGDVAGTWVSGPAAAAAAGIAVTPTT